MDPDFYDRTTITTTKLRNSRTSRRPNASRRSVRPGSEPLEKKHTQSFRSDLLRRFEITSELLHHYERGVLC